MTAIICFELIPEALAIASLPVVLFGIITGIIMMIICDIFVDKKFNKRQMTVNKNRNNIESKLKINTQLNSENKNKSNLLKTGIIVSIGLAIHNFPEGLAIGSGFEASIKLGLSLAIAICFHDIPEGISMAVPMKNGGMKPTKVIYYVVLSGITTGIGAFFRKHSWRNIARNYCNMLGFFSRCNDLYSIWRAHSRIKQIISWQNDSNR